MYREKHAVNTSARSLRRLPSPAGIRPRSPKSTCSSPPGGPSSTGVVTLPPPAPHRSAANRCSVRSATTTPCRASKMPIFTTGTPPSTHSAICCWRASSSAHAAPCPSGRTGRTTDTTCPISSSVSCSSPPSRDSPAATAALTYRLLVLRSTPACAATARSLFPASQALSASRTSITDTSRNTIPATSSRSTGEDQTGMTPDKRRTTPLVQLLATGWSHAHGGKPLNLVPCRWRMTTEPARSWRWQLSGAGISVAKNRGVCPRRPEWVPSLPRGPAVLSRPVRSLRPPLAPSSRGQALSRRLASYLPELSITERHEGFTCVHPPGLPLTYSGRPALDLRFHGRTGLTST